MDCAGAHAIQYVSACHREVQGRPKLVVTKVSLKGGRMVSGVVRGLSVANTAPT